MNFLITNHFLRELKRIKRKFPSLKDDLINSLNSFNPDHEIHIGKSIYKIRIKSTDLEKGKSGGLRSYIYLYRNKNLLVPIYIYSKSDKENLSTGSLQCHFQKTLEEVLEYFAKQL